MGLEDARQSGDCDSGYSCAYTNNLAWRSDSQPLPPMLNPRDLFERLFGRGAELDPEGRAREAKYRRSILDFVTADTKKLERDLGPTDRRKLDEYLSSIREVEQQLEKAERDNAQIDPHMDKPYGVPADFAEHFKPDDGHGDHRLPGGPDARDDVPGDARRQLAGVPGNRNFGRPPSADASPQPGAADGQGIGRSTNTTCGSSRHGWRS